MSSVLSSKRGLNSDLAEPAPRPAKRQAISYQSLAFSSSGDSARSIPGDPGEDEGKVLDSAAPIVELSKDEYLESFYKAVPQNRRQNVRDFLSAEDKVVSASLSHQFQLFRSLETVLSGGNPSHLVRPSGQLQSSLYVKLNYPTFSTPNKIDWEVADEGASCTRLWMSKGLKPSNTFLYESYFRRTEPEKGLLFNKLPMSKWSAELRELHQGFGRWCEDNGNAKVVLLCGDHVQKAFRKSYKCHAYKVVMSNDVTIQCLLGYADETLRLIGVFVYHPEYLLRIYDTVSARTADLAINLAAVLVGKESSIDATFLERRAVKLAPSENLRSRNLVFDFEGNALTTVMKALGFESNGGPIFTMATMPTSIISWLKRETKSDDIVIIQTAVDAAYKPVNIPTYPPTLLQKIQFMMSSKGIAVIKESQKSNGISKKGRGSNRQVSRKKKFQYDDGSVETEVQEPCKACWDLHILTDCNFTAGTACTRCKFKGIKCEENDDEGIL